MNHEKHETVQMEGTFSRNIARSRSVPKLSSCLPLTDPGKALTGLGNGFTDPGKALTGLGNGFTDHGKALTGLGNGFTYPGKALTWLGNGFTDPGDAFHSDWEGLNRRRGGGSSVRRRATVNP